MKKFLSGVKTSMILLAVSVILLGGYVYMLARPISYGMNYCNVSEYEGEAFEGTMKFYSDGTCLNRNSNFDQEVTLRYYYKDGYVFTLMMTTDEELEEEIAFINESFDAAVSIPFYAAEINAFRQVSEGIDDYVTTYTCTGAIVFAAVGGVIELALISLTVVSFVLSKKSSCKG